MCWNRGTLHGSRPGGNRWRLAAAVLAIACVAGGSIGRAAPLQMAYTGETGVPDDGLTRQSVDALARPDAVASLPPPSEYTVVETAAPRQVSVRHRRHRGHGDAEMARTTGTTPATGGGGKPARPWIVVKLIAFTNWWNGWAERNLHTAALDVHLDRASGHSGAKPG